MLSNLGMRKAYEILRRVNKKNKEGWCIFIRSILQSHFHVKKLQISNRFRTLLFSSLLFPNNNNNQIQRRVFIANDRFCLPLRCGNILQNNRRRFFGALNLWIVRNTIVSGATYDGHCPERISVEKNDNIWVSFLSLFLSDSFFFVRSLHTSYM